MILRALVSLGCGLLVLAGLAAPVVAAGTPPSLRLFGVEHQVSVAQGNLRVGAVDLGLWVASVGGAFQVDVRRPGYGAWTASQVDSSTGEVLRSVPAGLVDPASGLKRFLSIRFVDRRGRVAARRLVTFCPGNESARVDDTGPLNSTYLAGCSGPSFFPFVRGIVWGIDSGWAVAPTFGTFPGLPSGVIGVGPTSAPPGVLRRFGRGGINLKPGYYSATVSIAPSYRRLFAIPASEATVRLRVRVLFTPPLRPRPPGPVPRPVPLSASDPGVPSVTQPAPSTMPNLVALPAWQIGVRRSGGRELLDFNATIWNAGPATFSVEGFRRPNSDVMDAYEYFFDSSGDAVGRARAGTLYYDNRRGHHHWHLRQLAAYQLVGPSGQVVRSQKQSFCIAPSDAVDLTVPGADLGGGSFGPLGFGGSVCDLYTPGAIWLREQLPAGWGDTYRQSVAGQAFDITNLPNGLYRIEVRVNPLGVLTETSTADDLAVRRIRLSGHRQKRRVSVAPWNGIRG